MSKLDNVGLTTSDFRYTCTSLTMWVLQPQISDIHVQVWEVWLFYFYQKIDHLKQVEDYVVFLFKQSKYCKCMCV